MSAYRTQSLPLPESARGTVTVSVDVEDWHQLVTRLWSGELPGCSPHVEAQVERVLDLFDARGVLGTFFVLGYVARDKPALVKRIAERGHEIGSHGVSHVHLEKLDRAAVARELRDSRRVLEDITGAAVAGFRAPEFSISTRNQWVLEEVLAAGYRYDSSIYPVRHRRYGIADFPRGPARVALPSGASIVELPIGTFPTPAGNVPIGGGGYFRLFPGALLDGAVQHLARRGEHTMLYFHPYEFTRGRLALDTELALGALPDRLRARAWFATQAFGRRRLPGRVERVVRHVRPLRAVDLVDALAARDARTTRARGDDDTNETLSTQEHP